MRADMRWPRRRADGFTMLELMIAVAVVAILATLAIPSYLGSVIRGQVSDGRAVAAFVLAAVQTQYSNAAALPAGNGVAFPANNAAALVPPADRIVGHYVSAVEVRDGGVTITYGNQANHALAGHRLSLRPAVVDAFPKAEHIAWICGAAPVPAKMDVHGRDETDVPLAYLPIDCRPATAPSSGR